MDSESTTEATVSSSKIASTVFYEYKNVVKLQEKGIVKRIFCGPNAPNGFYTLFHAQRQNKMMVSPNNAKQVRDTTYTKIFVGGLAWETKRDTLKRYFEQFGEILEAVVIIDRNTGRSKGYGFVTFKDPDSAIRACHNPFPVIDGRRANCNLAALGTQKFNSSTAGGEKFSTTSWTMVPIPFQATSNYYSQHIPQYPFLYPAYRYPGYHPPQEIYAMNYYNVYGGQQLPIRWPPEFYHPFYGLRQLVPPANAKKTQYSESPPERFAVVGLSEPISPSPPISSGLITGTEVAAAAGMLGSTPEQKSST